MPDLTAISRRLCEARILRGLSRNSLSRRCGMSESTVWKLENGRVAGVEVDTVFLLADGLGIRRAWLILGEGPRDAPLPAGAPGAFSADGKPTWLLAGEGPQDAATEPAAPSPEGLPVASADSKGEPDL